jgi:uncharacterized protein YidB (DUF937 family)
MSQPKDFNEALELQLAAGCDVQTVIRQASEQYPALYQAYCADFFVAPNSETSTKLDAMALQLSQSKGIDYATALEQVMAENPDLVNEFYL